MPRYNLALLIALCALPAMAADVDRQLATSLLAISQSRLPEALDTVDRLTQAHPNFRLAQLVKGDLLLARVQPIKTLGDTHTAHRSELDQLREEARQRVRALTDKIPADQVPSYLLNLAGDYRHALVVDAGRSRLYVFENRAGLPVRIDDFYISIGKAGAGKEKEGDNRTPVGIYSVNGYKSPRELTDFYGSGAWTLSYPNEWDRRQGRTGHGIWIHGSPSDTYSRVPRASEGCVVLANDDLIRLGRYIEAGKTPVVIAESIDWVPYDALDARRNELASALEAWRTDWESRDTNRLLAHYAPDFRSGNQPLTAFSASKHRVNANKTWIKLGLDQVSLMLYPQGSPTPRPTHTPPAPGQTDFALVSFEQHYQSNNFSNRTVKRQFWTRENGRWMIVHETTL